MPIEQISQEPPVSQGPAVSFWFPCLVICLALLRATRVGLAFPIGQPGSHGFDPVELASSKHQVWKAVRLVFVADDSAGGAAELFGQSGTINIAV